MKTQHKLIMYLIVVAGTIFSLSGQNPDLNNIDNLNKKAKEFYDKGLYNAAADLYQQNLKEPGNKKDKIKSNYDVSLNLLGEIYSCKGDFPKAEAYYNETLEIRKEKYGKSSLEYAEIINNLAKLKLLKQEFTVVEDLLFLAMRIRKDKLGKMHSTYAECLNNLGYYYMMVNRMEDAKKSLFEATRILYNNPGENSRQYAESLFYIGLYYWSTADYEKSEQHYLESLSIMRKVLGKNHPYITTAHTAIITLYASTGKYDKAIALAQQVLTELEGHYGKKHPEYAGVLLDMGSIYLKKGDLENSEKNLKLALKIMKEVLGENHNYFFYALNSLAIVYMDFGYYEKAEPLLIESLRLRKEQYGESGAPTLLAMSNLASYYMGLGNYPIAESLLYEALQKSGDDETSFNKLPYIFINLGYICSQRGDYEQSVSFYSRAAEIQKKYLGEDHPEYLSTLGNLSIVLTEQKGDEPQIEALLIEVLHKRKKILGEKHPDCLLALNNLAGYYERIGEYKKAGKLYMQGIENVKQTLSKNNPIYAQYIKNIGANMELTNDYKKAAYYYMEALENLRAHTKDNFAFLSEKERELFWNSANYYIHFYRGFQYRSKNKYPEFSSLIYDCELFAKGLLLNSSQLIHRSFLESGNDELIELWNYILGIKKDLIETEEILRQGDRMIAEKLSLDPDDDVQGTVLNSGDKELIDIYQDIIEMKEELIKVENEIQQEEKKMIVESRALRKQYQDFDLRWQDIRDKLEEQDIAIEFIHFTDYDLKNQMWGESRYCALLLRRNYEYPQTIELCTEDELKLTIQQSNYDFSKIYPLVWKPIEKHLENIKNIYIAPSGLLHSIPFAGIKKGDHYLCDDYTIHNLLSTKDIIELKAQTGNAKETGEAVLFGAADFGLSLSELINPDKDIQVLGYNNLSRGILDELDNQRGRSFDFLPGSREEVLEIEKQLGEMNWKTKLYIDKDATETRFKSLSSTSSPRLLHISTHGFYFPQPDQIQINKSIATSSVQENIYRISNNPLMRSGLLFSGANHVWSGKEPLDNMDDGILTAYEVSNMNLSNTELVVLSACKTGLGDINESEGVYGLQRAFRLAGVKSIIASLWAVPDLETSELMKEFYKQWTSTVSIREAFSKAQNKLKNKYPDKPYNWAGFVLIE